MRKPNGYGSVMKLSGARRKPYAVRLHTGYNEKGTCTYKYLGYYATRKEAESALAKFNTNPYKVNDVTFEQLYEMYKASEMQNLMPTTQANKESAFKTFKTIHKVVFANLKPLQVQEVISSAKPTMQRLLKALYQNLEDFAIKNEITNRAFGDTLSTSKGATSKTKKIFTEEQIDSLWESADDPVIQDALILIYTGFRISEYSALTKDSIKDGCFVGGGKTEAGKNRIVPIHPRIMPLVKEKLAKSPSGVLCEHNGFNSLRYYWNNNPKLSDFTFHECRHTFRSRLDNADANETCINLLMGHKDGSVGKDVYTHKTIEQLKNTIAMLR